MKIKKEWGILAVIILSLILYLALRKQDRLQYRLPDVQEIPRTDISRIEISKSDSSIIITKKDDRWVIGPQEYLADPYHVESMLDVMEKPVLTAMVSDSKSYTRYGLDNDHRITVRIFSGDNMKREIELGNLTDSGRHAFIKLDNDYRVYHTGNNLRAQFNREIDELRDKIVLSFDQIEIREIEITKGSQSVIIALKEDMTPDTSSDEESDAESLPPLDTEKVWQTSKGENVDESLSDDLLSTLSGLSCREYLYDTKKEGLTDPIFTVSLKGIKEYILLIFSKKDDTEGTYPAVSSLNNYPFALADWRVEEIFETADKIFKNPIDS
ncbi:DUF4340 domain-containing protein [Deltaproteobacteria bacterium]|nr:DUF4340 domain-containing protein [Deltaproteobacteria bacterium]